MSGWKSSPALAFAVAAVLVVLCWVARPRRQHVRPM